MTNPLIRSTFIVVSFFTAHTAAAESISERLKIDGIPVAQWIITVDNGESDLVPAQSRLEEGFIEISADLPTIRHNALVAGIVHLADGRIISSPLHEGVRDSLQDASAQLAAAQSSELSEMINRKRERVAELEKEMEQVNADLRHRAGLDDVDRLLTETSKYQEKLEAFVELRKKAEVIR